MKQQPGENNAFAQAQMLVGTNVISGQLATLKLNHRAQVPLTCYWSSICVLRSILGAATGIRGQPCACSCNPQPASLDGTDGVFSCMLQMLRHRPCDCKAVSYRVVLVQVLAHGALQYVGLSAYLHLMQVPMRQPSGLT